MLHTFNRCERLRKAISKENKKYILGNRDNKRQDITDDDIDRFKQRNNLETDRDAIEFLINKMANGGQK